MFGIQLKFTRYVKKENITYDGGIDQLKTKPTNEEMRESVNKDIKTVILTI